MDCPAFLPGKLPSDRNCRADGSSGSRFPDLQTFFSRSEHPLMVLVGTFHGTTLEVAGNRPSILREFMAESPIFIELLPAHQSPLDPPAVRIERLTRAFFVTSSDSSR